MSQHIVVHMVTSACRCETNGTGLDLENEANIKVETGVSLQCGQGVEIIYVWRFNNRAVEDLTNKHQC